MKKILTHPVFEITEEGRRLRPFKIAIKEKDFWLVPGTFTVHNTDSGVFFEVDGQQYLEGQFKIIIL